MARLVLKCPYYKVGKSVDGYVRYIATRAGIRFDDPPYELPDKSARRVAYASQKGMESAIKKRYPQTAEARREENSSGSENGGGVTSVMHERAQNRLRT